MEIGSLAAFFQWAKRKSFYKDTFFRHLGIFEQKLSSKTGKYPKMSPSENNTVQYDLFYCTMGYPQSP